MWIKQLDNKRPKKVQGEKVCVKKFLFTNRPLEKLTINDDIHSWDIDLLQRQAGVAITQHNSVCLIKPIRSKISLISNKISIDWLTWYKIRTNQLNNITITWNFIYYFSRIQNMNIDKGIWENLTTID